MTTLPPISDAANVPEARELYYELQNHIYTRDEEKTAAELERKIILAELNKGKGLKTRHRRRIRRRGKRSIRRRGKRSIRRRSIRIRRR
jgi:hypothetical protein